MARKPSSPQEPALPSFRVWLWQILRRYFITGLATLFPAWITIVVAVGLFKIVDGRLRALLGLNLPGLGLLVTVLIILAVGVLTVHFFGRVMFATVEGWLSRLPLVRSILPAVKQLVRFLFNEEGQMTGFRKVVLVEYPRAGCYTLAFVTNESITTATGSPQTLLTLLIPTPPSPWSGPLILVPKDSVIVLTMTVEEALKLVVSGGVVGAPIKAARG